MPLRRSLVCAAVCALTAGAFTGVVPAQAAVNDPGYNQQWGMKVIGAEQAWASGTGAGITIAVVDSGMFFAHEDYASGKILHGRNFIEDGQRPDDDVGHGTHVAGIAAASTNNGRGVVGVAPDARILPVRVLENDGTGVGTGTAADVSAGIRWAADNGAHIINLSLGSHLQGIFGASFVDAVRYAWDKGVICVVAAGNSFVTGSGFSTEPAIVVSATNRNDTKPTYSSSVGQAQWGMAAPGGEGGGADAVLSTYWTRTNDPNTYAHAAGTSMAAPHVAGAAAILRGLGLSPQQTVDRLLATAKDIGTAGRDTTFGAGRLDVAKAVAGLTPAGGSGGSTGGSGNTGGGGGGGATGGTTGGSGGSSRPPGGTGPTSTTARSGGGTSPTVRGSASGPGPSGPGGSSGSDGLQIVAAPAATDGTTTTTAGDEGKPEDRVSVSPELPGPAGDGDPLPWAPSAAALLLLGAATRGIVRARRI